jgi:hypothetical protein
MRVGKWIGALAAAAILGSVGCLHSSQGTVVAEQGATRSATGPGTVASCDLYDASVNGDTPGTYYRKVAGVQSTNLHTSGLQGAVAAQEGESPCVHHAGGAWTPKHQALVPTASP